MIDAPIDAPGIDAPFVCGALPQMADDFNDGLLETAKWNAFGDPGTSAVEAGGVARMTLADNSATYKYAQFVSRCTYDARGHAVVVRSISRPRAAPGAETSLCLTHVDTMARQVCIDYSNDTMAAIYNNGTGGNVLASRTYNPALDRFWRLKEQAGNVYWETSSNGSGWATLLATGAPTDMSSVLVEMFGGTFMPVATPGLAEFDDLSVQ